MRVPVAGLAVLSVALPTLAAQDGGRLGPAIDRQRVGEVLEFLASDELGGRDTPSPGLERAADYIAEQFRKASLEPLAEGEGFFHRYTLPGMTLDSSRVDVTLHVGEGEEVVDLGLLADRDVRVWMAGGAYQAESTAVHVTGGDQAEPSSRGMRAGGLRPRFVVVSEDEPMWAAAAGIRQVLAARSVGGTPVLLVREGALPEGPFTATIRIPEPDTLEVPLRNPIGILRGESKPDEFVIVSAHYDHLGVGAPVDGDSIYNGADDDASGTAAVVVLAEALASSGVRPARSILFVCFSAEEKGLRGSRAFAQEPPIPLQNAVANLNIEMIGRPPPDGRAAVWITGARWSDFRAIAAPAMQRAGIRIVPFDRADQLFASNDSASLAYAGVVAHSISTGTPHEDYHLPSDEVEKIDLEHLTEVIAGIGEAVLEFATRPERPEYNAAGRTRLQGRRR